LRQLQQKRQEQQQRRMQELLSRHVRSYPITLAFPARVYTTEEYDELDQSKKMIGGENGATGDDTSRDRGTVSGISSSIKTRTSHNFLQYRLLEQSDLQFDGEDLMEGVDENTDSWSIGKNIAKDKGPVQTLEHVTESLNRYARDLESTGCYDSVRVVLSREDEEDYASIPLEEDGNQNQQLKPKLVHIDVLLKEKKWYNLYIGGGIKRDGMLGDGGSNATNSNITSAIPKVQFETTLSLLNLTGHTDITRASYTIDQTSTPTLSFQHSRPLYTSIPNAENSLLGSTLLELFGTQTSLNLGWNMDTIDYESIRSCKEHHQSITASIVNENGSSIHPTNSTHNPQNNTAGQSCPRSELVWSLLHRDLLPRRNASLPYLCDASPEVLSCAGPSLKHSLKYTYDWKGTHLWSQKDDLLQKGDNDPEPTSHNSTSVPTSHPPSSPFQPTSGIDGRFGLELAGPPGDIGFFKAWFGSAIHISPFAPSIRASSNHSRNISAIPNIFKHLAFHASLNGGILQPLSFGRLCSNGGTGDACGTISHISDRFFLGGPNQLRGFMHGGIGPRANTGGASALGGDAIGGDAYYTSTLAASVPFLTSFKNGNDDDNSILEASNLRAFTFFNAGTLTSLPHLTHSRYGIDFMRSTRMAAGFGLSYGSPMGRLEVTYAFPLRYGPKDGRKGVQFGFGMHFG